MALVLLYLVVLVLVAIVLFGVASLLFGRGEQLPPLPPGTTPTVLPASGVTGADVDAVKFTQTMRGYKTSEVDWVLDRLGLDGIAQVNLGVRAHRNRPLAELGPMSRQVVATLLSRCGIPDSGVGLTQFFVDGDGYTPRTSAVSLADRPPMNALRPRR